MPAARRRPTLKDIADAAECSTAVVSTVVNGARGNTAVSAAMRAKVERVARDLGYHANFASQSLARRSTQTLGIYIPPQPWSGPGYSYDNEVIRGIEAACREHGYDLLIINFSGSEGPEACHEKFAQRRVDGVVLVHAEVDSPWIDELARASRNVVAVDFPEARSDLDVVMFDNHRVSELAVEHLVGLGHTRIGFLGSCREPASVDALARQRAFLAAMARRRLEIDPRWLFTSEQLGRSIRPDEAVCQIEGRLGAEHFAALGDAAPTALLVYGDLAALHAVNGLKALGVAVPEAMSVVGVDDSEWCRLVEPHLTSIRKPLAEMGERATTLLIHRSRSARSGNPEREGRFLCEVFEPGLTIRDSTAPPSGRPGDWSPNR